MGMANVKVPGREAVKSTMRIYPQATQEYLADPICGLRAPKARSHARYVFRQLEEHVDKPLPDVTVDDLIGWLTSKPLSPATKASYVSMVKGLWRWATYRGHAKVDPTPHLSRLIPDVSASRPVKEHVWLSRDEISRLVAVFDSSTIIGRRDALVVRLGLGSGLRAGDVMSATWERTHLGGQRLSVTGKGGKLATVRLTEGTCQLLEEWADLQREDTGKVAGPIIVPVRRVSLFDGAGAVERPQWGQSVSYHTVYRVVRDAGRRAGIKWSPHDMRRTFAQRVKEELGVEAASEALRHSNFGVTERYFKRGQDAAFEATKGLDLGL